MHAASTTGRRARENMPSSQEPASQILMHEARTMFERGRGGRGRERERERERKRERARERVTLVTHLVSVFLSPGWRGQAPGAGSAPLRTVCPATSPSPSWPSKATGSTGQSPTAMKFCSGLFDDITVTTTMAHRHSFYGA